MVQLTEKEEDEDGHEHVEVVNELVFYPLEDLGLEQFVPCSWGDEGHQQEEKGSDLRVEKTSDQGPVKTHDSGLLQQTCQVNLDVIFLSLF